jgi:hypothetical protein
VSRDLQGAFAYPCFEGQTKEDEEWPGVCAFK